MKSTLSEVPTLTNESKLVPCPKCREPIEPKATLCKHCKSDFSWKRYFIFGQTTLALTTTLIAVIAAVGPQLQVLLRPKDAKLSIVLVGTTSNTATILISNAGSTDAVVSSASIEVKTNYEILTSEFTASPPSVVKSGQSISQIFTFEDIYPTMLPSTFKNSSDCFYSVHAYNIEAIAVRVERESSECRPAIMPFINWIDAVAIPNLKKIDFEIRNKIKK